MPRHENIHLRQLICLDQLLFRGPLHVAGHKEVVFPCRGQHRQPQLVAAGGSQRWEDGQLRVLKGQNGFLRHRFHRDAVLLRQIQKGFPCRAVLRLRHRQGFHTHPGQQMLHAVDVVIVEMGQNHPVHPAAAHSQQLVRRVASGVPPVVSAAAVHQRKLRPGFQNDALSLSHVHSRGVQPVTEPALPRPHHHRQRQDAQRGGHGKFSPTLGL